MKTELRKCSKCLLEKSMDNFYPKDIYKGKTRYDRKCKSCYKKRKLINPNIKVINLNMEMESGQNQHSSGITTDDLNELLNVVRQLHQWTKKL